MKLKRIALASAIAAAAMSLFAPAAFAANVLIVGGTSSPASDVSFTGSLAGSSVSFETDYGIPASCTAASMGGYLKRGASVVSGTKIGAITGFSLSSCTSTGLLYPLVMAKSTATGAPSEWGVFVTATPLKGANTLKVEIRSMTVDGHSTGSTPWSCDFGMTGTVPATFNQATQQLTISAGAAYPLAITAFDGTGTHTPSPSGVTFGGWIYTGDNMRMTAAFTLVTPGVGGVHF